MPIAAPPKKVVLAPADPQPEFASDLAAQLFDEEVAELEAQASVTTFIDVIAARRVKERLRKLAETK